MYLENIFKEKKLLPFNNEGIFVIWMRELPFLISRSNLVTIIIEIDKLPIHG